MPDGHAQRGVLHVGGLLAEDRAQQLLLRRQLRLALRRDLADQHVAGLDLGADVDDARLVQAAELRLAERADVAGDLLGTELGVARDHRQFLDVDRRVAVVADDALADQDRVLVVVAVPGHERDEHVLPERELAHVGRRAVGDDVAAGDHVADLHQRSLVDVGVLVRPLVLGEVVDVDADVAGHRLGVVDAHDDARRVDVIDGAAAAREHRGAGVDGGGALDAGADQRLLGPQAGHGLALHVGAHQRAVRVVVLEERDQRRGHRHDLARRDVHVLDLVAGRQHELVLVAAAHQLVLAGGRSCRAERSPARSRTGLPRSPTGSRCGR